MDIKKEIALWIIHIIVLTATNPPLSCLSLFLFPFSFSWHCFVFLLFFLFLLSPLPFHFAEYTSGLRSTNGNNLREGYNYLKNVSHSLLCSVWKMHVFSVCTADQLRQNCLVQDSTESIRSHLLQPKKCLLLIIHSIWFQSNRFLRDTQAAVHLSENPWAQQLPNPAGLPRTAWKLNKLALLSFSLNVNQHLVWQAMYYSFCISWYTFEVKAWVSTTLLARTQWNTITWG